jgi:hypothetical protein
MGVFMGWKVSHAVDVRHALQGEVSGIMEHSCIDG